MALVKLTSTFSGTNRTYKLSQLCSLMLLSRGNQRCIFQIESQAAWKNISRAACFFECISRDSDNDFVHPFATISMARIKGRMKL